MVKGGGVRHQTVRLHSQPAFTLEPPRELLNFLGSASVQRVIITTEVLSGPRSASHSLLFWAETILLTLSSRSIGA